MNWRSITAQRGLPACRLRLEHGQSLANAPRRGGGVKPRGGRGTQVLEAVGTVRVKIRAEGKESGAIGSPTPGAFVRESVAEAVGPQEQPRTRMIIHRAPAVGQSATTGGAILADAALNGEVAQAQIDGPSSPLLDMESTSSIDQIEPPGCSTSTPPDGNRFNVTSNTDAPAMTKLEVRGTDRANLLDRLHLLGAHGDIHRQRDHIHRRRRNSAQHAIRA